MIIGKHPWQFTAVGVIGLGEPFQWDDIYLQDKQSGKTIVVINVISIINL